LVIEPKSKNHNQKKKRGNKNDQIFKEILEDDSQKKLNILNRKRATTAVRNSTVIEYEDEEEPGLNKPYTPDKGGPIIDYC
jgi:parvulin-like peptidyl-prolyl isomerase